MQVLHQERAWNVVLILELVDEPDSGTIVRPRPPRLLSPLLSKRQNERH
jgi:hypothetical protein